MARFVGIPSVPLDADPSIGRLLLAVKENVELLTDQRGEPDKASVAITSGTFSLPTADNKFVSMSARGNSTSIGDGLVVPSMTDYLKALQDIQRLANDVATLRDIVNLLVLQLRSQQ